MSLAEFRQLYGDSLAKKELVLLREHSGDRMWKREPDGWHRLEGEPRER